MTETIWLKAHNLIAEGDWGTGEPHYFDREIGKDCYCAGGAISKAITGDAWDMYNSYDVLPALGEFAEYVRAPWRTDARDRVWIWNDNLATKESVLKALLELHEAEVASTT